MAQHILLKRVRVKELRYLLAHLHDYSPIAPKNLTRNNFRLSTHLWKRFDIVIPEQNVTN